MSDSLRPVSEDELHAYIDGQLPPDRLDAVLRHLQENVDAAAQVAAFAAQREALRSAFADVIAEAVPPALDVQRMIADRLDRSRTRWRAAAAIVLAFLVGGGGGWLLHGRMGPPNSDMALLAQDAIANHEVYAADKRRPTELGAEQRDDLARWVSNRLGHPVAPPDMSNGGFHYIGGRLAATAQGPAGLFMYQNATGARLTVFVLPMRGAPDAPIRHVDVGEAMNGCAWMDKGVGYTVVAPLPAPEVRSLAESAQRQLGGAT